MVYLFVENIMYNIFIFINSKKLTSLKLKKKSLYSLFIKNDIRGTIIISTEGLNGTISFKSNKFDNITTSLKKFLILKNLITKT